MKERFKELRNDLNLTQQQFADKIGVSRNNIAGYETGKSYPSDAVISLICREWNVNRDWLIHGSGEKFTVVSPYERAYNRFGCIMEHSSPQKKAALAVLLEVVHAIPDDKWGEILKQYKKALKEAKKED